MAKNIIDDLMILEENTFEKIPLPMLYRHTYTHTVLILNRSHGELFCKTKNAVCRKKGFVIRKCVLRVIKIGIFCEVVHCGENGKLFSAFFTSFMFGFHISHIYTPL